MVRGQLGHRVGSSGESGCGQERGGVGVHHEGENACGFWGRSGAQIH